MSTRRAFLRILGSAVVIVAAGGGYWAATRRPTTALAPWAMAGDYDEPRRRALSYAILAPNSHNMQPWLVDLASPDEIILYADRERLLPETDPFSRQIVISFGCFLETLSLAASADGLRAVITPFPDGSSPEALDDRPIARVRLVPGAAKDPLFDHVLARRTNKEPFDTDRLVPAEVLAQVIAGGERGDAAVSADGALASELVARLRELVWRGHVIEAETPRTLRESVDVMRIGRAEIEAAPDGIDLGGPFLEGLSLVGLLDREQLADPKSDAYAQGMAMYREIIFSAQGFFWMTTTDNDRHTQLEVGRGWMRAQLTATALGLSIHPISQTLQEYPEMAELYDQMPSILGAPGRVVQMLARVGYGAGGAPSPRWPIQAKVI